MRDKMFRELVRSEVQFWLETNSKALKRLYGVVAEQLAPVMQAEIQRGLLKRTGQLEPDERDEARALLEECADQLTKFATARKDFDDELDNLGTRARDFANRLGAQIHPDRRPEPMGGANGGNS